MEVIVNYLCCYNNVRKRFHGKENKERKSMDSGWTKIILERMFHGKGNRAKLLRISCLVECTHYLLVMLISTLWDHWMLIPNLIWEKSVWNQVFSIFILKNNTSWKIEVTYNQESVQETHSVPCFVPNYMMKSVPIVMPLTWVHMNPHNDHYASSHNLGFVRILLLRIITLSKRCSQENI